MKTVLRIIGWIGIVFLGAFDLQNPHTGPMRKPDDENVSIIGLIALVIFAVLIASVVASITS